MSEKYDPKEIEPKWQKKWTDNGANTVQDKVKGKDNEYILVEFAYPSGNLHAGHWYAFSVPDAYARYRKMLGKNVLYPMGFDAFGLPAENAAIKRGVNPREWTFSNIDYMRKQLVSMGASFDWSREVITASPEYYKWTQWLFLKFFEKGLAYQSETPVNWCPNDKTVLANEQVIAGRCERCDALVERRKMLQWNLKITDYADRLIDDLESLDWPQSIKDAQVKWIGRSFGEEITFSIKDLDKKINVFTTRPDTIKGATYLVLAPEHPLIDELKENIINFEDVKKYINDASTKAEIDRLAEGREKTGIELKGLKAINPSNEEEISIWIADYVVIQYGTGAIMAVPSDDKRDNEFAMKFKLPITENYEMSDWGKFGTKVTKYKLRDWVVSRQRYWGCPIPIIHCETCGIQPVPEHDLPVVLPEIEDYLPSDDGKSPLSKVQSWVNTNCPNCGKPAKRETDTLDTFIDSSWYYLRYTDPKNTKEFASKESIKQWMPISFYSGGAEHTNMHLLYSRFFYKVLFDLKYVEQKEPYQKRMNRGLILGPDNQKMSKSRGNVIDPDDYVNRLGSDTVRTYMAFIGPYNEVGSYPWNPDSIIGVRRFLEKVWDLIISDSSDGKGDEIILNKTIKDVTESLEKLKMNTAVSSLMKLASSFLKTGYNNEDKKIFIKLLAPFAPHISEELWERLGNKTSIFDEIWPQYDPNKTESSEINIAIQVNGKVRGVLKVKNDLSEDEVKSLALNMPEISKWVTETPQKVIIVPNKVVNIVL